MAPGGWVPRVRRRSGWRWRTASLGTVQCPRRRPESRGRAPSRLRCVLPQCPPASDGASPGHVAQSDEAVAAVYVDSLGGNHVGKVQRDALTVAGSVIDAELVGDESHAILELVDPSGVQTVGWRGSTKLIRRPCTVNSPSMVHCRAWGNPCWAGEPEEASVDPPERVELLKRVLIGRIRTIALKG